MRYTEWYILLYDIIGDREHIHSVFTLRTTEDFSRVISDIILLCHYKMCLKIMIPSFDVSQSCTLTEKEEGGQKRKKRKKSNVIDGRVEEKESVSRDGMSVFFL